MARTNINVVNSYGHEFALDLVYDIIHKFTEVIDSISDQDSSYSANVTHIG